MGQRDSRKNGITPAAFDTLTDDGAVLWGAKAIAERINRSPEFVRRTLAKLPDTPIRSVGGQLCVGERKLLDFVGA